MKTYEEMARDVLKRRDEELASITQTSQINPPPEVVYPGVMKKRSWIPKIAIPCAAAVLVGVVGVSVWKNVRGSQNPNLTPGIATADEDGEYIFQDFVGEQPESIYKGGKTEIYINETEYWNAYSLPNLSGDDFRPIDDDKINSYYGLEFDRLSRVFPEWESEHEPFGTYAHDEDDGFAASHRIIFTANSIEYAPEDGNVVIVAASLIERYDSATVENAKPSVVNGFDAIIYHVPDVEYSADITMGSANITIRTFGLGEDEFLNILDVYTAADEGGEDDDQNRNHNQTMEDKIVILDNRPDFIIDSDNINYELEYIDYSGTVGVRWRRYSAEELNAVYGLNFTCFNELHPEWRKNYDELEFGVNYKTDDHAIGGDIPQNREILEARNRVNYRISEDSHITIITRLGEIPNGDVEHSVINGYDAVIFRESPQHNIFGAIIDMDGTLICATMEIVSPKTESGEEFVDLLREYTSEASKYVKPESITPSEFTVFNAVDPFDDYITYEVSWDVESCWWTRTSSAESFGWLDTDDLETTLGCLKDFFGTDKLPVDETFKSNLKRYQHDGRFCCITAEGAKAYSPVDGKVVAVYDEGYNGGLGKAVTVEFGDGKFFIIGHFAEVNVEVGDYVKPGQVLGVCGQTGAVAVEEDEALLTLIPFVKLGD